MRRSSFLMAAIAALVLAFSPGLADARAGGGRSFGSRGGMTYEAPPTTRTAPWSAAPMERSITPRSSPYEGYRSGGYGYGYRSHSPFMSGLMGGFLGAGIGGLMFGHGFWHGGMGMFGFLGLLLQIFLLVWVVRFLLRLFTGGGAMLASNPAMFAGGGVAGPGPVPMGGPMGGAGRPIAIGPGDYQAFEQSLQAIQAAWTAHDLAALRSLATPEMLSYFAEQLAEQESRGVRNEVRDVRLVQGDLAQAWNEGSRDYATVALRFSMIDVTRDAYGRIVDGSPTEHVTATEVWTFLRAAGGGQWILSAVQQTR